MKTTVRVHPSFPCSRPREVEYTLIAWLVCRLVDADVYPDLDQLVLLTAWT